MFEPVRVSKFSVRVLSFEWPSEDNERVGSGVAEVSCEGFGGLKGSQRGRGDVAGVSRGCRGGVAGCRRGVAEAGPRFQR